MDTYIASLVQYGLDKNLIHPSDRVYITNQLLQVLELPGYTPAQPRDLPLEEILETLIDDAVKRKVCKRNPTSRDLLSTKLMGVLTPLPSVMREKFVEMYSRSPKACTDWLYQISQDTDYIRTYRIKKDRRWKTRTIYGDMDITINLSKPEKDPRAIAAALAAPQVGYPKCQLCLENEGYAGRQDHPARQNLRVMPIFIDGGTWYLQYSPYSYYNEHCIAFNSKHTPMVIDYRAFSKLLDFVTSFPHYFVGSNADLPIVGGSILSHEHFQGGCYCFPMERAPLVKEFKFRHFPRVRVGIVRWPMSVLRLRSHRRDELLALADLILRTWRDYSDPDAGIFAQTDGVPHNTITPIARRRDGDFELDLVLRNNLTTDEHPLGLYHPHKELHHIKKENIGLIEVMGLAVLPARLKSELSKIKKHLLHGTPLPEELAHHRDWVAHLEKTYHFTQSNATGILQEEVGHIFTKALEHAGVYFGKDEAFRKFISTVDDWE